MRRRLCVLPRKGWSGCAWRLAAIRALLSAAQRARVYPDRPIRVIIPFTAGSATDLLARRLAVKMSENWGQQVVIDNRGGGGGTIASSMVAKATPDGYTLLTHSIAFAMNAALYSKLPYDSIKDFAPASQIAVSTSVMLVSPALGARSVKDLIALAKQKPGQLNFGSSGVGSGTHLNAEQFRFAAGIDVVHVPYKGVPETLIDLMTGRIHYFLSPLVPALPLLKEGQVDRAGGDHAAPQRGAARRPHDGGGGAAGLPLSGLVRRVRARSHAAADRREAEQGDCPHRRIARHQEADAGAGRGGKGEQPRGIREIRPARRSRRSAGSSSRRACASSDVEGGSNEAAQKKRRRKGGADEAALGDAARTGGSTVRSA
jgi:hypothetical protein